MRRGDPDPRRGVHGLQQVAGEFAQRAVKHGHGLRRERQPRVGITDDRADGHAGYAGGCYASGRISLMSWSAAHPATSSRFSAVAIRSGNWSGVQANTGMPRAATLADNAGS